MSSVDKDEIALFSRHAREWWKPDGSMRPLHKLNPARLGYVRDRLCQHFGRKAGAKDVLKDLSILDIGCGGGLLCEPLARLGAAVTGLDASAEAIEAARAHAAQAGLKINYVCNSIEDFARHLNKNCTNSPPLEGRARGGMYKVDPSPAKTKGLLRKPKFLLPLPQGERRYDVITALEILEHVADMDSFLKSAARLLKPGGIVVLSTVNRTVKSYALGIVAAEYILKWVPRGTHDWRKFIKPSELAAHLCKAGLTVSDITGVVYDPLNDGFHLRQGAVGVNYMMTAIRGKT